VLGLGGVLYSNKRLVVKVFFIWNYIKIIFFIILKKIKMRKLKWYKTPKIINLK